MSNCKFSHGASNNRQNPREKRRCLKRATHKTTQLPTKVVLTLVCGK